MKRLTKEQKREIAVIAAKKDEDIDLSDMPEVIDWSDAEMGKFYRPPKRPVTMRLDADVVEWLKSYGLQEREWWKRRGIDLSVCRRSSIGAMPRWVSSYRPPKRPVTMRLDADVVEWLKSYGPGYQTKANLLLRHAMRSTRSSKVARKRRRA